MKISLYMWVSGVLLSLGVTSIMGFIYLFTKNYVYLVGLSFLNFLSCSGDFSLYIDWVSSLFCGFVMLISGSVVYFSVEYMEGERRLSSFLLLVCLFVASMLVVIFSLNLVSIILGWDGLGLSSYLLVIYYQNMKALGAGMITALTNRLGDVAIMISIALFVETGGWEFMSGLDSVMTSEHELAFLMVMIGLAAVTKSAQFPFSAWLPAAMAAPTPVSALVHSSTLVTAGVYLLLRFSPVFQAMGMSCWLLLLGGVTMTMASLGAMVEVDMKKIVAFSTLSQLGLMCVSLSLGMNMITLFHLLTHACFKALMFLCVGKVMHDCGGGQDIRSVGSVGLGSPVTSSCLVIAGVSLCGFPFLSGFYSKDMIYEMGLMGMYSWMFWLFMVSGIMLSSTYSFRLLYFVLAGGSGRSSVSGASESASPMSLAGLLLMLLSVMSGCILSWFMFPSPGLCYLSFLDKVGSLLAAMFGVVLGYKLTMSSVLSERANKASFGDFSFSMWYASMVTGGLSCMYGYNFMEHLKNKENSLDYYVSGVSIYKENSWMMMPLYAQFWGFNSLLLIVFMYMGFSMGVVS